MYELIIEFYIDLEGYKYPKSCRPHGPKFHRFLPDGKNDALDIYLGHERYKLKIWFDRWGFTDESQIEFTNKKEVDPSVISKQGILDGGPLFGEIIISNISEDEKKTLVENSTGDDEYIALAKLILKIVTPHLERFISILRTNYGQYWIPEFHVWDSRTSNLGSYCKDYLNMKWSFDNRTNWQTFVPENPSNVFNINSPLPKYSDMVNYLTVSDWADIGRVLNKGYIPSSAAHLISYAYASFDNNRIREALIDGHAALEAAVNEVIKLKFKDSSFSDLLKNSKLTAQVFILSKLLANHTPELLEYLVKAIKLRNAIIHDGITIKSEITTKKMVVALLTVASSFVSKHNFKFPSMHHGNAVMSLEKWEQLRKEHNGSTFEF